jgi:hypothetical protein
MNKKKEMVYSAVFVLFLCGIAAFSFLRPFYNWDLLGYVGATLMIEENKPAVLHQKTYDYVKNSIPPGQFAQLIADNNPYRKAVASDPVYFESQVHLYTIRPLYVGLMYSLSRIGVNIVSASVLISVVSSFFIGLLFRTWLLKYVQGFANVLICMLMIPLTGVAELARLSTPDALSTVIILAAMFLFIEEKKFILSAVLLVLSILARADNILIVLTFFTFFTYYSLNVYKFGKGTYAFILAISLILFSCIIYFVGGHTAEYFFPSNYHWRIEDSGQLLIVNIIKNYIGTADVSIKQLFFDGYSDSFLFFTGLGVFIMYKAYRGKTEFTIMRQIGLVALLAVLARLLIFPVVANRFFVPYYAIIGLMFIAEQVGGENTVHEHNAG